MKQSKEKQLDMIDFKSIFKGYLKKWWLFAVCAVVCTGLAFVYTQIHKEKYLIKANVLISNEDSDVSASFGGLGNLFGADAYVEDEVFIVSSHSVIRQVVKDLNLNTRYIVHEGFMQNVFTYKDYPVGLYCDPAIADTLGKSLLFKVKVDKQGQVDCKVKVNRDVVAEVKDKKFPVAVNTPYGKFILNKTKAFKNGEDVDTRITFSGIDAASEAIESDLKVDMASRKSNVIQMELESTDVEYAKDVLNAIIAQYNVDGVEDKNLRNQKTLEFLDSRLALLTGDLSASEAEVETFKKSNGLVDVGVEAQYQLEKKGKLEEGLIEAETNLQVVKLIKDFISNPKNQYELVPATIIGKEGDNSAIAAYNQLILERIKLSQNAKQGHTALNAINEQIEAMRRNILSTVDKTYESSVVTVNEIRNEMGLTKSSLGDFPSQERQYRDIKRQQAIKEQLYIFLLQKREETSMMLANSQPKGIVVDAAYSLTEPLGAGKKMILALGFLSGIILAAVIIYLQRKLRNRFESREEIERLTQVPILGEMCTSRSGESLVVRDGGSTSAAELFRLIRSNLQFVLGSTNKVILLTSSISGEGKSFISINLASSLALLGKKVLLVGMDIRNPKLGQYLELPPAPGFTEYISSDNYTLDDIIRHDAVIKNMDIITAGPVPPNPSELLNEHKVDEMFETLRKEYDYILIDSAPVGMVSDTFTLNRLCDATVYVCRANYTTLKEVHFFNSLYEDGRLKKMSLVVNGTAAQKSYGYQAAKK